MPKLAREIGAAQPYYDVRQGRPHGARGRHVPDRPRRRDGGPDAVRRPARPGAAPAGRLALAEQRRARLGEPVRRAGLALRGRGRQGGGEGRVRRDPVRLRPLPERRRRLADRLPPQGARAEGDDDRALPALRGAQLHPLGVRVSADVFGLAATHDLGIGQVPKRVAKYVDTLYPMVYPSHFGPASTGSRIRTRTRAARSPVRSSTSAAR